MKELFPNFVVISKIYRAKNTKLYIPYYDTKTGRYSYVMTTFSGVGWHKRKPLIWKILEVERGRIIHIIKGNEEKFRFTVPSTPKYYSEKLDLIRHIMSKSATAEILKVPEELAIEV